jgi:hypothetical protein
MLRLFVDATETIVTATASTKSVLSDLTLVHGEIEALNKTAAEILLDLKEHTTYRSKTSEDSDQDLEEDGFGTTEVANTMELLLRQLKLLQRTADTVSTQMNKGSQGEVMHAFFSHGSERSM